MKITLKEVQVDLSQEEAKGPVGQMFSKWIEQTPNPQETCLLPTAEIAHQLKMSIDAFRLWLYRDERLQKLAYLRDGSRPPMRSRAAKYFRLSEIRPLIPLKKNLMRSTSHVQGNRAVESGE